MLTKFPSDKRYKKCSLFSFEGSNSSQFTFNSQFLYELKHKVYLSKTVCGIFHFRIRLVFIQVCIFVQQKAWSFTLKHYNSSQNKNNRKATPSFALRPLIFKLQQVWKFDNLCVSWSFRKTDLETNFLNLEYRSFKYVTFFQ